MLNKCLLRFVKLSKNADLDKNKFSGYGKGYDSSSECLFTDESMGRNVIIFGVDMSSSVHVDNKIKDNGLDDTTLTRKNIPCISFTQSNKIFVLHLHHNGSNNFCLLILQKYTNLT